MKLVLSVLLLFAAVPAFADSTFLAEKTISLNSSRANDILDRTVADIRMVFQKFELALDSSTKIIVPKKVSGTAARPVMTVTARKCVLFVCETISIDAESDIREVSGNCDRNFILTSNLGRSSQQLRDIYERLEVNVCFKSGQGGRNSLKLVGYAHHSAKYNEGLVQKELLKLLQLQVDPISKALQDTLKAKEQN
jgi:hypothetical protein